MRIQVGVNIQRVIRENSLLFSAIAISNKAIARKSEQQQPSLLYRLKKQMNLFV